VQVWQSVLANAREFVRGADEERDMTSLSILAKTGECMELKVSEHEEGEGPT
jgi:hypothetical protein